MKKILLQGLPLFFTLAVWAQESRLPETDSSWIARYRESAPRINDLVHTKLAIRFDYERSYAYGKVELTLTPHFYPTDSLELDAKALEIHAVKLVKGSSLEPLKYTYDGNLLHIALDRTYKRKEVYRVWIDYTAKPNEYTGKGSSAITSAKGLYFINPKGEDPEQATQIWTQGETEGTSVWVPIIDKPNQKTTQEFQLTVPGKYVTLSNGKLTAQQLNPDGTRTDTWKMELPHAPYLFFMGVGDYAIVKDRYKNKEVNYYVEKKYADVARKIFGNTPEMMAYFSRITGVDYPWVKYAQITGQDYVSGAMENTTATLHSSQAQQDARELKDGNAWEYVIAHELFHQWFGDYVTTESWSNITLNESFANYSEVLWSEYKYGKDQGAAQNYNDQLGYLSGENETKPLVRFYYKDREDLFDAVSYNKGGRVLHMLRNLLGDSAFFNGLRLYLNTYRFKAAEAHQLRLAMEEVSGRDLNWFFNQWYYGSGHPKLSIEYLYNDAAQQVKVMVQQTQTTQAAFRFPLAIDLYQGATRKRYSVWVEHRTDTFLFSYDQRPDLINVDAEKILLAEKKDPKTLSQYFHQYKYAGNYVDRREAIEFALQQQEDSIAQQLLLAALQDPYKGLRNLTLSQIDLEIPPLKAKAESLILSRAEKDPDPVVRAAAIQLLSKYNREKYHTLFLAAAEDSSYTLAGAGLAALHQLDPQLAEPILNHLIGQPKKGKLLAVWINLMLASTDEKILTEIVQSYARMELNQEKFDLTLKLCEWLGKTNSTSLVKAGVDAVIKFRDALPEQFGLGPVFNNLLQGIISKKEAALTLALNKGVYQEQIEYIRKKLSTNK